ncbi:MAG: hypothetical protein ABJQ07_05480 [Erythrobacter sp.]
MELIHQIKVMAVELTSLDRDSLHVYVAIGAFFLACVFLRRKASSWLPWFAVLALALLGEYLDARHLMHMGLRDYPSAALLWEYHAKDFFNTMIAPTVIVLVARHTSLFDRPPQKPADESSGDEP